MNSDSFCDYIEIRMLVDRCTIASDSRNWGEFRLAFAERGILDFSAANGPRGSLDEVIPWMDAAMARCLNLHHNITTHHCVVHGDTADAISYVVTFVTDVVEDQERVRESGSFYRDTLVRRAGRWRIAERRACPCWVKQPVLSGRPITLVAKTPWPPSDTRAG